MGKEVTSRDQEHIRKGGGSEGLSCLSNPYTGTLTSPFPQYLSITVVETDLYAGQSEVIDDSSPVEDNRTKTTGMAVHRHRETSGRSSLDTPGSDTPKTAYPVSVSQWSLASVVWCTNVSSTALEALSALLLSLSHRGGMLTTGAVSFRHLCRT